MSRPSRERLIKAAEDGQEEAEEVLDSKNLTSVRSRILEYFERTEQSALERAEHARAAAARLREHGVELPTDTDQTPSDGNDNQEQQT